MQGREFLGCPCRSDTKRHLNLLNARPDGQHRQLRSSVLHLHFCILGGTMSTLTFDGWLARRQGVAIAGHRGGRFRYKTELTLYW